MVGWWSDAAVTVCSREFPPEWVSASYNRTRGLIGSATVALGWTVSNIKLGIGTGNITACLSVSPFTRFSALKHKNSNFKFSLQWLVAPFSWVFNYFNFKSFARLFKWKTKQPQWTLKYRIAKIGGLWKIKFIKRAPHLALYNEDCSL